MSQIQKINQTNIAYQLDDAIIRIENLRLRTLIGFNPEEQIKPQDVVINATISFDATQAAKTDDENHTLDYKVISKQFIHHVENGRFRLLEKLNADLVDIVMANPQVLKTTITVDKPHALRFADSVSVTLTANRLSKR